MFLARLQTILKPYVRLGQLGVWADDHIEVGERKIDDALRFASVGVLLVSQNFFASDFIADIELPALVRDAAADHLQLFCAPVSAFHIKLAATAGLLPYLALPQFGGHPESMEYVPDGSKEGEIRGVMSTTAEAKRQRQDEVLTQKIRQSLLQREPGWRTRIERDIRLTHAEATSHKRVVRLMRQACLAPKRQLRCQHDRVTGWLTESLETCCSANSTLLAQIAFGRRISRTFQPIRGATFGC